MDSLNKTQTEDRPIKVLHIAPTPFFSDRGCHVRIRGTINALNKRLVRNVLCTYNLGRDVDNIEIIRTAAIPGYKKQEAGPSVFKYLADILLFFKVCALISSRKPDIIHAHLHEGVLLGWTSKILFFWLTIPLVFDMQGSLVGELESYGYFGKFSFLRNLFIYLESLILRMPDQIVCSSQNSVDILHNKFNLDMANINLINDGADEFDYTPDKAVMNALSLPDDKALILYTGALVEAKGLTYLCNTILESSKRKTQCHFLVVGYPDQELRDFCIQNQLLDRCTIVGRVPYEKLGAYLGIVDIALEPKLSDSGEGSGKLLNYMGAGLPVVCFETASNRQILGDFGYYASTNHLSLVDQIEAVLADPVRAAEVRAAVKKRAHDEFSWDAAGKKVLDIYNACLSQEKESTSGQRFL